MPQKLGRGHGKRSGRVPHKRDNVDKKQFFDHDDRVPRGNRGSRPRVSFKTARDGRVGRNRNLHLALKLHADDDVDMSPDFDSRRIQFRGGGVRRAIRGGRNSPAPSRADEGAWRGVHRRLLKEGADGWFKIIIPYGQKYGQDFILKSLMACIAPEVFVPVMYTIEDNAAIFYVDDYKLANKLLSCDRKVTTDEGFKMAVKVKSGSPKVEVNEELKGKIKATLAKRFIQETNALDLSQFHKDPDLCRDTFCPLSRTTILLEVLDIIGEHTPNLKALNLDGNKLRTLDRFGTVACRKLPALKILYIGDNKIQELRELNPLKGLKLEELRLAGNPLCNKYTNRQDDYVHEVRKRFPKLLKLDGVELPAPIVFDVAGDDALRLPPIHRAFAINEDARKVATTFLHQYFTIFDSGNRQSLLDAYNEQAYFSLTITFPHNTANRLTHYLPENRNLLRVNDTEKRHRLLKIGKLPIVSFISEIPKTQHYLDTFTMDLCLVTDTLMLVTVTGTFKELDTEKGVLRYFNRTLIIVPQGSGYCIQNEQLHIADPTERQRKEIESIDARVSTTPSSDSTDQQREQMMVALTLQSGMNREWSKKCLEEVHWNFDAALAAFRFFQEKGQMPSEAFQN